MVFLKMICKPDLRLSFTTRDGAQLCVSVGYGTTPAGAGDATGGWPNSRWSNFPLLRVKS